MRLALLANGRRPASLVLLTVALILVDLHGLLFWLLVLVERWSEGTRGIPDFGGISIASTRQYLVMTFFVVASTAWTIAIGYGLLNRRRWSRGFAVASWTFAGVLLALARIGDGMPPAMAGEGLFGPVLASIVAWAYLYRYPSVRRYFAGTEEG